MADMDRDPTPLERFSEGLAQIGRDFQQEAWAAYVGTFYGQMSQAHLTGRSAMDQELGLSNVVGGTLEAMRDQLIGREPEQEQELDRGQERGR